MAFFEKVLIVVSKSKFIGVPLVLDLVSKSVTVEIFLRFFGKALLGIRVRDPSLEILNLRTLTTLLLFFG